MTGCKPPLACTAGFGFGLGAGFDCALAGADSAKSATARQANVHRVTNLIGCNGITPRQKAQVFRPGADS